GRRAASAGQHRWCSWHGRRLESRWNYPIRSGSYWTSIESVRDGRGGGARYTTRSRTREPPLSAISTGWPAFHLLWVWFPCRVSTPVRSMQARPSGLPMRMHAAVVSPSGFLLFPRQTTLFAQAFDFKRQELSGNPFPVAEQVAFDAVTNTSAGFSATSG